MTSLVLLKTELRSCWVGVEQKKKSTRLVPRAGTFSLGQHKQPILFQSTKQRRNEHILRLFLSPIVSALDTKTGKTPA